MNEEPYKEKHEIGRSKHYILYNAVASNGRPVILKTTKPARDVQSAIQQLRHEHQICMTLQAEGVIRTISLDESKDAAVLVIEDAGYKPLDSLLSQAPLDLATALKVACSLANSLATMHQAGFLHRDIQPQNILVNIDTAETRLHGMGSATQAPRAIQRIQSAKMFGTPPSYVSPELTGRTNQLVDYRTDLYALGVNLFQLVTGRLPFELKDPLELVHAHVAKLPPSARETNPSVPQTVADIILKLMEKSAEDRYQGGHGLRRDLERCLNELKISGEIQPFDLAEQDPPSRFELHQGFYGRELESKKILTCYNEVTQGKQKAIVVGGSPGVGKTALINELKKTVLMQQGWFISGKYEAIERDLPYSGIREALLDLMQRVIPDQQQRDESIWEKLEQTLGSNLGVVLEVVPEMRSLFGETPPVLELDPLELKNRFQLSFLLTLEALATKEHPLVLFLDDMQWADPSSLELIESLFEKGMDHFLLLATYRNSAVDNHHPLAKALKRAQEKKIDIEQLNLSPLESQDIRKFVAASLRTKIEIAAPLADLVYQKTGGNAFYTREFLTNIYEEKLLYLDNKGSWAWNLAQIAKHETTENVFNLARHKTKLISDKIHNTITTAAALGRPLDVEILAMACESTPEKVECDLIEACKLRILIKTEEGYRFEHDRLQESVYALIPKPVRTEINLRIGRIISTPDGSPLTIKKTFQALDHLNQALELIQDPGERENTARLNLVAGRTARSAAAFPAAFHYFSCGLKLLCENCWENHYDLALALHASTAEAALVTANFREADRLFKDVISKARTLLDKIPTYETWIAALNAQLQEKEAFHITLDLTKFLGIEIPENPTQEDVQTAIAGIKKSVKTVLAQPASETAAEPDAKDRAAMKLLAKAANSAGMINFNLYLIIANKLFEMAIRYPSSTEAPVAYVMVGGIFCSHFDDHENGFKIADRGAEIQACSPSSHGYAFYHFLTTVDINCWRLNFDSLVNNFIKAHRLGLEGGDLTTASMGAYYCCETALHSGMELSQLEELIQKYYEENKRLGVERVASGLLNLEHTTQSLKSGVDASYRSQINLIKATPDNMQAWHASADHTVAELTACHEMMALFLYRRKSKALETSLQVHSMKRGAVTALLPTDFYICLSLLDALQNTSGEERAHLVEIIGARQDRLRLKAKVCPINHQHKLDLVEALQLRAAGNPIEAMDYYDRAIEGAKKNSYLNDEGLANELAAEFFLDLGRDNIATMYLHAAISAYSRWGAEGKLEQLYKRYRTYLARTTMPAATIIMERDSQKRGHKTSDMLDITSIERAAAALAQEIDLQILLDKFIKILLQNAGAQRCFLLRHEDGQIVIEASGSVDDDQFTTEDQLVSSDNLSYSIVKHVSRTFETIVTGDAVHDERFANTPYVLRENPRSILCAPVMYSGKPVVFLYLENNRSRDAFNGERLAAIQVISSQAAIALENARLLAGARQEVSIRKEAEENLHQALSEVAQLKDKLQAENLYLREENDVTHGFDEMVGKSEALKKTLEKVAQVANTEATVLILGETGTGKELIAHAIHNHSPRKDRAMVRVNCATLPANLIESELFGHEKGAFTGAYQKKVGRFELADGGSIFLDEIGELPLELQAKLLRVLQEGEFERVGSSLTKKVSVRVIAATNRDLESEIEKNNFRSDLYFRLSVFPISVPPLRSRSEDIPLLAWFFINKKQAMFNKKITGITKKTMAALMAYKWPGNIRELQNILERGIILTNGNTLTLDDSFSPLSAEQSEVPAEKKLEEVERLHIMKVLEQCGWKVKGKGNAADQLGLNPSTLTFRMKKLGIKRPAR